AKVERRGGGQGRDPVSAVVWIAQQAAVSPRPGPPHAGATRQRPLWRQPGSGLLSRLHPMATKPSIPKGTRDFSPQEMLRRQHIFDTIRGVFQRYGFLPMETP